MMIVRFRSKSEHEDILKKIKKMKKFTEDLEECLEESIDNEEYDSRRHNEDYDDDEIEYRGRYGYRRGGSRR